MGGEFAMNDVKESPRKGEGGEKFIRRNGLQAPYDVLQVMSWFIIAFLGGCFFTLLAPMLPSPWNVIVLVVYAMCLVAVVASGFETGRCDPADPYIKCSEEELEDVPDLLKCSVCVSRVNKLSRHCLICDKCVVDYDHHCRWLNNCIGQSNYKSFICLIVSTLLLVAMQLSVSVVLFAVYVGDTPTLEADLALSYMSLDKSVYLAFVGLNGLLGLASFMMVSHLVSFHIYLGYYGLTTYNYVMATQMAEELKNKKSNAYMCVRPTAEGVMEGVPLGVMQGAS